MYFQLSFNAILNTCKNVQVSLVGGARLFLWNLRCHSYSTRRLHTFWLFTIGFKKCYVPKNIFPQDDGVMKNSLKIFNIKFVLGSLHHKQNWLHPLHYFSVLIWSISSEIRVIFFICIRDLLIKVYFLFHKVIIYTLLILHR